MSFERSAYVIPNHINSLMEFSLLTCCRPISSDEYIPPTPAQISDLVRLCGWTEFDVARITGVHYTPAKGCVTLRRWKTGGKITYSNWRLLVEAAGLSTTGDALQNITRIR